MLVLSRRIGETIVIGDNISIHLVRIGGDKVRIGIDAPKGVKVLRGELKPHFNIDSVEVDDEKK